ncbi:hypothetical protein [Roseateles paludis]|uniref:Alpha/beta hydrolase n=1 Tax=Roseateles paludis TaxID=3145238 RepID=A0ABV0FXR3_9BURK
MRLPTPVRLASLAAVLCLCACGGPGGPGGHGGRPGFAPEPITPLPTLDAALRVSHVELPDGLPVELLRRPGGGALPVVVYLPGLGQHESAGQRWKWAWAEAGYAVVSLQPLDEDLNAWRSELARTGEFAALGRLHYGPGLREQRLKATQTALAQLRASLPAAELDWQRVVVAGYETGAQTALDLARPGPAWQPQGVLAISPQPEPAPPMTVGPATPAPTPLGVPALLVSSDADLDPLSLLRESAQRLGVVDAASPWARWVVLHGTSHAGLAGTLPTLHEAEQDVRRGMSRGVGAGGEGGGGRRGRGGGGGMYGEGGGGGAGAAGVARGGLRSGSASEAARADLRQALQASLDFLAAHLRGDTAAQARLQNLPPPRFDPLAASADAQRRPQPRPGRPGGPGAPDPATRGDARPEPPPR